jgi:hypothetical protein
MSPVVLGTDKDCTGKAQQQLVNHILILSSERVLDINKRATV